MTSVFRSKLEGIPLTAALENTDQAWRVAAGLQRHADRPAIVIGSGGSAISATFLAACRRDVSSVPTSFATPMEFVLGGEDVSNAQVWLFSGRGDNADIVACLEAASTRKVSDIRLITSNSVGRAATIASRTARCTVHHAPVADPKDGFLSTHSLIAAMALALASTDIAVGQGKPARGQTWFSELISERLADDRVARFRSEFAAITDASTLIVLADPLLAAAAVALETSIWECALCSVQRTDMRNFAHGRHVLLARRPQATHVLGLTTFMSDPIWDELGGSLPHAVSLTRLQFGTGSRRDVAAAVIDTLGIIEALGDIVGVDPGRPGIGDFAKRVYEGGALEKLGADLNAPIRHKVEAVRRGGAGDLTLKDLAVAQETAAERLRQARFDALIVDYDGTIVTTEGRYSPPDDDVLAPLLRLLEGGVVIGIATGRGGSLGETLRVAIPDRLHDRVIVGYYNGGHVRPLGVDIKLDRPTRSSLIDQMSVWLKQSGDYPDSTRDSDLQLSIMISDVPDLQRLERRIAEFPGMVGGAVRVASSKHSIDIGVDTNTKLNVHQAIAGVLGRSDIEALCLGDSGHVGGNDFELLGQGYGVSVDTVCHRSEGCWSLFGDHLKGPAAVARIFEAIELSKDGTFRLAFERIAD